MTESQKISVITVTYNAGKTLQSTIDSVLSQTYPNIEYIIIDGKSTDNTLNIINNYRDKIGYFISEPDRGIYDAMNKGINAATGEWLIFMGADDVFFNEHAISDFFEKDEHNGIDFIYGDAIFTNHRKIYGGVRDYNKLIEGNICHQAIFYRRSIFIRLGNYNMDYKILADYDLNLRIFRDKDLKKEYVPIVVSLCNNKGVTSGSLDGAFFDDQLNHLIEEKRDAKDPVLQQYYYYHGLSLLLKKRWRKGIGNMITGIMRGKRKIFFFLLTGKVVLSMMGIGKKIKIC